MAGSPDPQICPMHADEFCRPVFEGSETADYTFTCSRSDHPVAGAFSWPYVAEPVGLAGDTLNLGLADTLPAAVRAALGGSGQTWVEYGCVEQAYGRANPEDWRRILAKYGHTHYQPVDAKPADYPYTASKYLARSLSSLTRLGTIAHRFGPGTGRWAYNATISYYAFPPGDDWSARLTWAGTGLEMATYMPEARPR
jgi:hypothetical protein